MSRRAAPMRIGYIVDHPKRDLGGALMFAHAFARLGGETALIPMYDQGVDVPLIGLDGLITPFARPANRALVQSYCGLGLPVWVLDTEGGVLIEGGANDPAVLARYVRDSGFAELLRGYFFWGAVQRDAFVEASGMPAESLHLTGQPRFDFAAPKWRGMLDFDRRDFVLVNTNFSGVNSRFAAEDDRAAMEDAGWEPDYLDKVLRDIRLVFEGMIETIGRLADDLPDQLFLVRPHPFERAETYRRRLAGRPNVVVDGSGSVLNAIAGSRCVLHLNCGTSIEAIMLGKMPVSLDFLATGLTRQPDSLPARASMPVADYASLKEVLLDLDRFLAGFDFAGRYGQLIEPYFHLNDGMAADRVARVVAAHGAAERPKRSLRTSLAASRASPTAAQRARAAATNLLGSRAASRMLSRLRPSRGEKRFEPAEVERILNAISDHEGGERLPIAWHRHPLTRAPLSSIAIGGRRPLPGRDGPDRNA